SHKRITTGSTGDAGKAGGKGQESAVRSQFLTDPDSWSCPPCSAWYSCPDRSRKRIQLSCILSILGRNQSLVLAWMHERTSVMHVCLFEDQGVAHLEPLTLTRPVFELLCGQTSLARKQARYFAPREVGVLIRPGLVDLFRLRQPTIPVNDLNWLRGEAAVLVNGRWLPPVETL